MSLSSRSRKRSKTKTRKVRFGTLKKNDLKQFGYSTSQPFAIRKHALELAVKKFGALSVFRKLNAVFVLTKNRAPRASAVFKMDRDWIHKQFMSVV
jgi:hypothetical protein